MVSKWISVNDKLPSDIEDVLVYLDSGVIDIDLYNQYTNEWDDYDNVTHWMELPKPPMFEVTP